MEPPHPYFHLFFLHHTNSTLTLSYILKYTIDSSTNFEKNKYILTLYREEASRNCELPKQLWQLPSTK